MLIARSLATSIVLAVGIVPALSQSTGSPPGAPGGGGRGIAAPLGGGPAGFGGERGSAEAPPAPTGPLRVTTDTPEFCDRLADRVARAEQARPNAPRQVEELAEEGHQMCTTGLIRGGLVRLRRALMMLYSDK
jgi:hypothetical protein